MKINLLKMNFIDAKYVRSDRELSEICASKRHHIIKTSSYNAPTTLAVITSRIRDKRLKHQKRPIEVRIGNKNNAN